MEKYQILYMFEHKLLPHWFYENKMQFVGMLLDDKEVLFRILNDIYEKEKVENPYKAEEFKVTPARLTDDVMFVQIDFPKPEQENLCYKAYMFFDKAFEKIDFFTIERGESDDVQYACGWTDEGVHLNLGQCTFEKGDDFFHCSDAHMKEKYGLVREDVKE